MLNKIMGLDSVELVMSVETAFGIAISDGDVEGMITPAMLIAHVQQAVGASAERRPCITQRAFHLVRADLMGILGAPRSAVRLKTSVSSLFPRANRKENWEAFRSQSFLHDLPDLRFGRGWLFTPTKVSDLVTMAVFQQSEVLVSDKSWSRDEVREVVRQIIRDQLGIKKFSDDDEFVRDLGVD